MYRIIIPLDGSQRAEQALSAGVALAQAVDGAIVLTHVVDGTRLPTLTQQQSEDDAALAYLKQVAQQMSGDERVAMSVLTGDAAEVILHESEGAPPAIIVMATHGRGGVGRLVRGSVGDTVMRRAHVPVVLVPDGVRQAGAISFRKILVPLDGSDLAESVLPLAIEIARNSGATLHLIRVVEPFWSDPALVQGGMAAYLTDEQIAGHDREHATQARAYLARVSDDIEDEGVRPVTLIRYAKPDDGIARAALDIDADLILMSSHGLGGIKRWAFGSVAAALVHRKVAPVLVLPYAVTAAEPYPVDSRNLLAI